MVVTVIRKSPKKGYVIIELPTKGFEAISRTGGTIVAFDHAVGTEVPIQQVWEFFKNVLNEDDREDFREKLAAFSGHEVNPLQ